MKATFSNIVNCIIILGLVSSKQSLQATSCQDENGKSVDWFIAYKFPLLPNHSHPLNTGYGYSYIASPCAPEADFFGFYWPSPFRFFKYAISVLTLNDNYQSDRKPTTGDHWTISDRLITDDQSAILKTLAPLYGSDSSNINSVYYNDGPPTGLRRGDAKRAHAKGVLALDESDDSGFWMSHSTPQFPPPRDQPLEFHRNSVHFGQTFICISFNLKESGAPIVKHLINMYPMIYDSRLSDIIYTLLPDLRDLPLRRNRRRKARKSPELRQVIKTISGQELRLYSKSDKFGDDLYSGWLDHDLNTNLLVQTWRRGSGGVIDSTCPRNDYHVNNIEQLTVYGHDSRNASWSYLDDHSKWAISENQQSGVVCINDINRMRSQFQRGGGAICIRCPACWTIFRSTIADLEPCKNNRDNSRQTNISSFLDT